MNTTRKGTGLVLIMGVLLTASLFAQGARKPGGAQQQLWLKFEKELGMQTRYSADMDVQVMGMVMPSKTYRLDGKSRIETTVPMINLRMVALTLTENGKTVNYQLFPDKKKYCIAPDEGAGVDDKTKLDYKLEELGTETYENVACKKRRMTVTMTDGETQVLDMLFSPAQKNMPVKMTATVKLETEPGKPPMDISSVVLFKNYKFAVPAASLFVVPKDYAQAKDMEEIMMEGGGLFGLPQQQTGAAPAAGATLPPEALEAIRQAQADADKDAKADVKGEAAKEGMRQGLQGLRNLLGK